MDPVTLAAAAITAAVPYVAALGKEAAKGAAGAAGKSVWEWVKGRLTSESGKEAISDIESNPDDATNRMAVTAALTKLLRSDANALSELAQLLEKAGAIPATLSAVVTGDGNAVGQVVGDGSVSIKQG